MSTHSYGYTNFRNFQMTRIIFFSWQNDVHSEQTINDVQTVPVALETTT